jgi:hypothetical protein
MLRLNDRILTASPPPNGTEHPPVHEPESLGTPTSYVSSTGATARSAAVPHAPRSDLFGDRVSHITHRFVLSASGEAYRIWRYRSAEPAIEFPVTEEGWALAWTTFRRLDSQA